MTIQETFKKFRDDFIELLKNNLKFKVDKVEGKDLSTNDYTNEDKNKLEAIEENANNYTLPEASSTLGGVKTTSNVSSPNGYTACPIISGIPYYKNDTYNLGSFQIDATPEEINKLHGVTVTTSEFNNLKDSRSNIQSQLDNTANSLNNHTINKSNPHEVTKLQLGLGNVEDKTSADIRNELTSDNIRNALGYLPISTDNLAGENFGLVKTGGDVTITDGIITINSNSHKHNMSEIMSLQTALDLKASLNESVYFKDIKIGSDAIDSPMIYSTNKSGNINFKYYINGEAQYASISDLVKKISQLENNLGVQVTYTLNGTELEITEKPASTIS